MNTGVQSVEKYGQLKAVGLLIGGISSFQIGATLAKGLFPLFGPTGMVGLRVCMAALILLAIGVQILASGVEGFLVEALKQAKTA